MISTFPYIPSYNNITKCLNGIITAKTPQKFSTDFLNTVLKMTGGSATPVIKYLKNIGFLTDNGTPTKIYGDFRNPDKRGSAAAAALRHGYEHLFKHNEYAYKLTEDELKQLIVSTLGCAADDGRVASIAKSFGKVNDFANFEEESKKTSEHLSNKDMMPSTGNHFSKTESFDLSTKNQQFGLNLGYTINLNLPESTNPEVYSQIFKALKEELLTDE